MLLLKAIYIAFKVSLLSLHAFPIHSFFCETQKKKNQWSPNNIQFNDIFRWSTSLNDGSLSNNFNYTSITHKQLFFGDNKQPFKQTDSLKWIELFDLQTQEKKTTKWGLSSLMDKEGHTSLEWPFLGEASL